MFGKNKKMQSNADVTDIGNGSSRMKVAADRSRIFPAMLAGLGRTNP